MHELEVADGIAQLVEQGHRRGGVGDRRHQCAPLLVPVLPAGALLDREDYTSAFLLRPWRQEQPGLRVAGPQLQGSSLGQDPTVVDDQHVVGCLGLLHVVRREDDREPERFAQVPDRVPHLLTAARASKDSGPKTPTGRSAS